MGKARLTCCIKDEPEDQRVLTCSGVCECLEERKRRKHTYLVACRKTSFDAMECIRKECTYDHYNKTDNHKPGDYYNRDNCRSRLKLHIGQHQILIFSNIVYLILFQCLNSGCQLHNNDLIFFLCSHSG